MDPDRGPALDMVAEYHLKRPNVFVGSACDGVLEPGDRILSVNNQSVEGISHKEAQQLFRNCGSSALVEVSRLAETMKNIRDDDDESLHQAKQVLSDTLSGLLPHKGAQEKQGQPVTLPRSKHLAGTGRAPLIQQTTQQHNSNNNHIQDQAYRTTPLILPNAKTIHDSSSNITSGEHPSVSSSHHFRNSCLLLPAPRTINELPGALRYKPVRGPQFNQGNSIDKNQPKSSNSQPSVYNSPAPLYSDEVYQEVASQHPGYVQACKPQLPSSNNGLLSNPQESETFKMILEAEMGNTSTQPSVSAQPFNKQKDGSRPSSQMSDISDRSRNSNSAATKNDISQSTSFKKLMYSVLGETDF